MTMMILYCNLKDYYNNCTEHFQFSSVQSLSRVQLSVTPWTAARQAFLSINFWSLLKFKSIASVMPSSHLILCCPLLLLPPIPPSIRVFSNESTLHMRWPKQWSFSFSISPSIALTRQTFVSKVMSLLLIMQCRLVITFLPRSKHLLISWLQSPSAVILEPKKIKSDTVSSFPIYFP